MLLSISPSKRTAINASLPPMTSTPARPRSSRPSAPFPNVAAGAMTPAETPAFQDKHPLAPRFQEESPVRIAMEQQYEAADEDALSAARAFMETKEYIRAVHWLRECMSTKATFLSVYSQYLVRFVACLLVQALNNE